MGYLEAVGWTYFGLFCVATALAAGELVHLLIRNLRTKGKR